VICMSLEIDLEGQSLRKGLRGGTMIEHVGLAGVQRTSCGQKCSKPPTPLKNMLKQRRIASCFRSL